MRLGRTDAADSSARSTEDRAGRPDAEAHTDRIGYLPQRVDTLDGLDVRVGRMETKFDHLERDVTTLFRRDFGDSV